MRVRVAYTQLEMETHKADFFFLGLLSIHATLAFLNKATQIIRTLVHKVHCATTQQMCLHLVCGHFGMFMEHSIHLKYAGGSW